MLYHFKTKTKQNGKTKRDAYVVEAENFEQAKNKLVSAKLLGENYTIELSLDMFDKTTIQIY